MNHPHPRQEQQISIISKIPWTFTLIIYLLATHFSGISLEGLAGFIFIGLGVVVLIVEFVKSGDISTTVFLIDITSAVIALIAATALLSYLIFGLDQTPSFYHWFGYVIIVGDALFSPFNAFRTALRNFGV